MHYQTVLVCGCVCESRLDRNASLPTLLYSNYQLWIWLLKKTDLHLKGDKVALTIWGMSSPPFIGIMSDVLGKRPPDTWSKSANANVAHCREVGQILICTYIVDMKIISTWISNYVNITVAEWAEREERESGGGDCEIDGKTGGYWADASTEFSKSQELKNLAFNADLTVAPSGRIVGLEEAWSCPSSSRGPCSDHREACLKKSNQSFLMIS